MLIHFEPLPRFRHQSAENEAAIVDYVRRGHNALHAGALLGILPDAMVSWLEDSTAFQERVNQAERESVANLISAMEKRADKGDRKAIGWLVGHGLTMKRR